VASAVSPNREPSRPEMLVRLGSRAATKNGNLSQFSHGLTGRYGTRASSPDTWRDADLPIRIPTH